MYAENKLPHHKSFLTAVSSLRLTTPGLKSGLAYLFKVHAIKEWTVWKLGGGGWKGRIELGRGRAAMLPCFYWLPISPDTSASSAVAIGNHAAASRPVHQRLHCAGRHRSSSPCLSLSLSPRSCIPSSSASSRRSRTWMTSTWTTDRSWSKLRTSSPESSSSSESNSKYVRLIQQIQPTLLPNTER